MSLTNTTSGNEATGMPYVVGTEAEFTTFTGDLTGDITGDVTGNVTGDVTGDLTGDVTGYRAPVQEDRTATADGTGTGQISTGVDWVNVTVTNADHIITLPEPVVGTVIHLFNGATGYELRTSAPATIAINGGTGATAETAIAASTLVKVICVSATAWRGYGEAANGTLTALDAAA